MFVALKYLRMAFPRIFLSVRADHVDERLPALFDDDVARARECRRQIIGALMRDGRVRRAYLGIAGGSRPLPPRSAAALNRSRGLEVVSVVVGSPAAEAHMKPEDIIVSVDGAAISDVGDLQRLMTGERVGRPVTLEVVRGGQLTQITVRPTELEG